MAPRDLAAARVSSGWSESCRGRPIVDRSARPSRFCRSPPSPQDGDRDRPGRRPCDRSGTGRPRGAGSCGRSAGSPAVELDGPLPACADRRHPGRSIAAPADWARTLLDPIVQPRRPPTRPADLVPMAEAGLRGRRLDPPRRHRRPPGDGARRRADGVTLRVRVGLPGLRGPEPDVRQPRARVRPRRGPRHRPPGPDIPSTSWGPRSTSTAAMSWLAAHAWRFGFVEQLPAPTGARRSTCYKAEPWHDRVGRASASRRLSTHSGLSLREWLWLHARGGVA